MPEPITISGTITQAPQLRQYDGGRFITFSIVEKPRVFNRDTQKWEDGKPSFYNCVINDHGRLIDNVLSSLNKGQRVIARAEMRQREYTDKNGAKRTTWEAVVKEIGPSLLFAETLYKSNNFNAQQGQSQSGAFADPAEQNQN